MVIACAGSSVAARALSSKHASTRRGAANVGHESDGKHSFETRRRVRGRARGDSHVIHAFGGIELVTIASDAASYASAHFPSFSDAHAVIDAVHVKFPAFLGDQTARSFEMVSPRITDGNGVTPLSFVKRGVELGQEMMGLLNGAREETALPTGKLVEAVEDPGLFVESIVDATRREAGAGALLDENEWTKVLKSVDIDIGLLLASVVVIVPLFKKLALSPVLGFLGIGLLLHRFGLFVENQEVDQFCELGIQFLLFEMGLELSVKRLTSLAKYAFGLGFTQVLFVNLAFAAALLPAGSAIGTAVLEYIQPGNDEMLQVSSVLEAVVIGFALSLSSSAFGLQLLADRKMLTTKFGTASLGVLLFQDLAVVPFIILLPVLQSIGKGGDAVDVPLLAAGGATSLLDLGFLAFAGRFIAVSGYKAISKADCSNDVFVAMSLLVLFGFSFATSAIGFSDSLGAFLAGIVLADTVYSHTIIRELQAFKGLFLSLFFVTIGTTIDLPLALHLWPVVLVMTLTLMASKTAVVTALGPAVGLTWREALVAGAFLSQGGEFAFVIFGQATSGSTGSLFPMGLDELLVVVVILSMALTPLTVDLALKIAGPEFMSPCDDDDCDVAASFEQDMMPLDLRALGNGSVDVSMDFADEEEDRV